jgi:hypothetical protein
MVQKSAEDPLETGNVGPFDLDTWAYPARGANFEQMLIGQGIPGRVNEPLIDGPGAIRDCQFWFAVGGWRS